MLAQTAACLACTHCGSHSPLWCQAVVISMWAGKPIGSLPWLGASDGRVGREPILTAATICHSVGSTVGDGTHAAGMRGPVRRCHAARSFGPGLAEQDGLVDVVDLKSVHDECRGHGAGKVPSEEPQEAQEHPAVGLPLCSNLARHLRRTVESVESKRDQCWCACRSVPIHYEVWERCHSTTQVQA